MNHLAFAQQQAEDLLDEMGTQEPNVDIFQVASAKGCQVKFFQPEGELAEISGFLDRPKKIIYVNSEDHPKRQVFTIAHELGHLLLEHQPNEYGVLTRFSKPNGYDRVEQEANWFAGCLLVPQKMLKEAMKKYRLSKEDTGMLSNLFGVSQDVIRIRLKHIP